MVVDVVDDHRRRDVEDVRSRNEDVPRLARPAAELALVRARSRDVHPAFVSQLRERRNHLRVDVPASEDVPLREPTDRAHTGTSCDLALRGEIRVVHALAIALRRVEGSTPGPGILHPPRVLAATNPNLTPDQHSACLEILHRGLVQIRIASVEGDTARAEAIADALHNLPHLLGVGHERGWDLATFVELFSLR